VDLGFGLQNDFSMQLEGKETPFVEGWKKCECVHLFLNLETPNQIVLDINFKNDVKPSQINGKTS